MYSLKTALMSAAFAIFVATVPGFAGIISGNGGGLLYVEPTEPPNLDKVNAFLKKLNAPEPTWVGIIQEAFSGPAELTFLKTDERCFLSSSPQSEVRAAYENTSGTITFCKAFYDLDQRKQVLTFLHELSHFALARIGANLGEGEEVVVQQMEYWYGAMYDAANFSAYESAIFKFRDLLDKHLENLVLFSSPAEVVPDFDSILVLNSEESRVRYPVPRGMGSRDYIRPHFLEFNLHKLWTSESSFSAKDMSLLDPNPYADAFPSNDAIWSMKFLTVERGTFTHEWQVKFATPSRIRSGGFYYAPLKPIAVKRTDLSDEFRKRVTSGELDFSWIRTVGAIRDANHCLNGKCPNDRVYVFVD
ncbi:MAG: hypothetical protein COT74_11310 [Bdellovibrionales bacterium CG10_big_fil_rev_8_21_14_0_10_45_34]|nr:MAG: hypothetical protein COT74_11310 [Bdellovibrionales bacterium CG10_big_fil_rev_8_21_14_0_10_45_34]